MKSLQTLFIAAVAALVLSACSEKKPNDNIIAKKPAAKKAAPAKKTAAKKPATKNAAPKK